MNLIILKIGLPATLEQLAEEAAELSQAALKLARVIRGDVEREKRLNTLIFVLKYIIKLAGFDLLNRIEIRERKSGGNTGEATWLQADWVSGTMLVHCPVDYPGKVVETWNLIPFSIKIVWLA